MPRFLDLPREILQIVEEAGQPGHPSLVMPWPNTLRPPTKARSGSSSQRGSPYRADPAPLTVLTLGSRQDFIHLGVNADDLWHCCVNLAGHHSGHRMTVSKANRGRIAANRSCEERSVNPKRLPPPQPRDLKISVRAEVFSRGSERPWHYEPAIQRVRRTSGVSRKDFPDQQAA
jgi:hypothetical protein